MDVKESIQEPMALTVVMKPIIEQLGNDRKFPAVHVYTSALHSFQKFSDSQELSLSVREIFQPGILKDYETWLRSRRASWNTVSTYMRTLQAVYNRLLLKSLVDYNPQLFDDVYTKVESLTKRALTKEQLRTLLSADSSPLPPEIQSALAYFLLTFLLRGMPFIDLAHLQKNDLRGDTITYCRHKTGRQIVVHIPRQAQQLLDKYRNKNKDSIYLFPILDAEMGRNRKRGGYLKEEELHKCYLRALHRFNSRLVKVAALLLPDVRLSSYTARHTWATLAFHRGIHVGIISVALGHSSIKVTETYLKPFDNEMVDTANAKLIQAILSNNANETVG